VLRQSHKITIKRVEVSEQSYMLVRQNFLASTVWRFLNALSGYIPEPVLAVNCIYTGSTSFTANHYHLRFAAPPNW